MTARIVRSLAAVAVAAALLWAPAGALPGWLPPVGPLAGVGPRPVSAATPDLTLVTDARYVVQPTKARIHVVVDITATNRKADTTTRTFTFDGAYLAVMPGTRSFSISSAGVTPTVRVKTAARTYTLLAIGFGHALASGASQRLRLGFDLPDPGGAPTRDVRVGASLVAFPVWAFATGATPGSSVTVIFPAGYSVAARAGILPPVSTGTGGTLVYRTGRLANPLAYYAYLTAERPPSLVTSVVRTSVGATPVELTLERWADDPAWADRIGGVFRRGLPVLGSSIGLPYPTGATLTVREATSRATGGYAGLFDARTRTVEVAYDADSFVSLHEAAHVWFNGTLLADRWANEAFASYYAADTAGELEVAIRVEKLTPAVLKAAIPLNAWGPVGTVEPGVDDYGYAASYRLATLIAERAGPGVLRAVWASAAAHAAAYQPIAATAARDTATDGPPDWRALLDLLEERTGIAFSDLWSRWVARPADAALLADRAATRRRYEGTVRAAGDWELSPLIRLAMDRWQFGQARTLLGDADAALAERARLEAAAAAHGLTLPEAARTAFEGESGPGAALAEMRAELAAIDGIAAAEALSPVDPGFIGSVGLFGERPAADLAAARGALAAGDLGGVAVHVAAARAAWLGADDVGLRRVFVGGACVLVVGAALVVALVALARRRRTRAGRASGTSAPSSTSASSGTSTSSRSAPGSSAGPVRMAVRVGPGVDASGRYGTLGAEPTTDEPGPPPADQVDIETERRRT